MDELKRDAISLEICAKSFSQLAIPQAAPFTACAHIHAALCAACDFERPRVIIGKVKSGPMEWA